MLIIDGNTTLDEARDWVHDNLKRGVNCPCCSQMARIYKIKLSSQMAKLLILFCDINKDDNYIHTMDLFRLTGKPQFRQGEFSKLAYWGLIEQKKPIGNEIGRTSGYWRVTPLGREFAAGEVSVKKHVYSFDATVLRFSEENTTIDDSLGDHFTYKDLMGINDNETTI